MAFPTTGVLDDFQRADENPLSDGGKWVTRGTNDNLQLQSLRVRSPTSTILGTMYWGNSSFAADQEAFITITTLPAAADFVRLYWRLQSPGTAGETGYMFQWSNDANGLRIFKETARETFTVLAQDAAARYVANDQLGVAASSTTHTVYKNGAAVLSVVDATTNATGYLAFAGKSSSYRGLNFGGGATVVASGIYPGGMII